MKSRQREKASTPSSGTGGFIFFCFPWNYSLHVLIILDSNTGKLASGSQNFGFMVNDTISVSSFHTLQTGILDLLTLQINESQFPY